MFRFVQKRVFYRVNNALTSQFHSLACRSLNAIDYPINLKCTKAVAYKSFSLSTGGSNEDSKRLVKIALIGNGLITCAKAACWLSTGSSAMLSETVHSLVDSGNQALLLVGLRGADAAPDKLHPYGYGKSIYFWSLVSALGTFWFGAGISFWNSLKDLLNPALELHAIGWEVWMVLSMSFVIDGYVLRQTVKTLAHRKPKGMGWVEYIRKLRDPTTAAVLMEDGAACCGVLVASCGIAVSQYTQMIVWDNLAGITVAGLLGAMGLYLARLNQRFLLGQSVDSETINRIQEIVISRPSVEGVHSVQSQWIGPNAFAYKAEVEIDGTFLAAKLLSRYQKEFMSYIIKRNNRTNLIDDMGSTSTAAGSGGGEESLIDEDEIRLLLAWYAEDVMRVVEQEVSEIESQIRAEFPAAQYIEIEPDSSVGDSLNNSLYAGEEVEPDTNSDADTTTDVETNAISKFNDSSGPECESDRLVQVGRDSSVLSSKENLANLIANDGTGVEVSSPINGGHGQQDNAKNSSSVDEAGNAGTSDSSSVQPTKSLSGGFMRYAIDDGRRAAALQKLEIDTINQLQAMFNKANSLAKELKEKPGESDSGGEISSTGNRDPPKESKSE